MNRRKVSVPRRDSSGKSMRTWTHPSPKCPYMRPSSPYPFMRASSARRYSPSLSGGTAESSQPGHAWFPAGVLPPRPAPSARICHSRAASGPAGRMSTAVEEAEPASALALDIASAPPSSPTSTISHPPPSGSGGTPPFARRTTSTSRASMPSTASGRWARRAGTSSAALAMSG